MIIFEGTQENNVTLWVTMESIWRISCAKVKSPGMTLPWSRVVAEVDLVSDLAELD